MYIWYAEWINALQEIAQGISFAPIGLLDMFNTGGAVEHFEIHKGATASASLRVRGSGRFGVYSSQKPVKCVVGDNETDFNYESETGLLTFYMPVSVEDMYKWPIEIQFWVVEYHSWKLHYVNCWDISVFCCHKLTSKDREGTLWRFKK